MVLFIHREDMADGDTPDGAAPTATPRSSSASTATAAPAP